MQAITLLKKYQSLSKPLRAALWFVVCSIIQKGIGVIVTPVFTRLLTTEEYGLYTLYASWLEIIAVIVTLRLSWGVFLQGIVRYDYKPDEYTASLQGLTTLLVGAGLCIYLPFQEFWNGLTGLNTFLMLCVIVNAWALAMLGFWTTRQRIAYNYRLLVLVTLAVAVITPVVSILAVMSVDSYKVEARVGCITAIDCCIYTVMFLYYEIKGRSFFNKQYWTHALKFNVPLVPHYLAQSVLHQADRVMLSSMVSMSAAGVYGLANSISSVTSIINQSILKAFNPWVYQQIRAGCYDRLNGISYASIAVVGVINLLLIAFAPEALWIFAPPAYQDAIWVIPPLAGSVLLAFMYSLFANFEFYFEKTKWIAAISIGNAVLNVALNLVFIPLFGLIAAGYTTLASYAVNVTVHFFLMRRVQRREMGGVYVYDAKVLLCLCAAFALTAVALVLAYPFLALRAAFCVLVVGAAYMKRSTLEGLWREVKTKSA